MAVAKPDIAAATKITTAVAMVDVFCVPRPATKTLGLSWAEATQPIATTNKIRLCITRNLLVRTIQSLCDLDRIKEGHSVTFDTVLVPISEQVSDRNHQQQDVMKRFMIIPSRDLGLAGSKFYHSK
jgi:hypothetical protein